MGGCCCTPQGAAPSQTAVNYFPNALEEQAPFSSHQETAPMLPPGLVIDTNLDASGTYRSPPTPVPYDVVLGHPQTPAGLEKTTVIETTNSALPEQVSGNQIKDNLVKCEDLKLSKGHTDFDLDTEKDEIQLAKLVEPIISSPEECPTCLEEYDDDNPKLITKCDHHFHLACILEWLERSDTCPVCDKEMVFDAPLAS